LNSLDHLYAQAAIATAEGSKSFYFATRFFPPELARAAHAVYWFCRYTDDVVDECNSVDQGRRDLAEWTDALRGAMDGTRPPQHSVLRVFVDTANRYRIPFDYAFDLIAGMQMDLEGTRYETFEDLRLFCYRVASVVGLMMCHVIGFEHPEYASRALPHAIDLGIAMQLTNILRDIAEDLERNRIYLPAEDMACFGYTEGDLRSKVRTQAFEELMRFEAHRARQYYERGNAGISLLHPRGRFAVKIASDVYREILARLEQPGFDVFNQRAVVPSTRKYWLTARNVAVPVVRVSAAKLAFWKV
jgi:phytoene synthase